MENIHLTLTGKHPQTLELLTADGFENQPVTGDAVTLRCPGCYAGYRSPASDPSKRHMSYRIRFILMRKQSMDIKQMIEQANKKAAEILTKGRPVWVDVQPAGEVIPGMTPDTILIAGPPIAVEDIPLPVKNAICGALLYEQRAETAEGAWAARYQRANQGGGRAGP